MLVVGGRFCLLKVDAFWHGQWQDIMNISAKRITNETAVGVVFCQHGRCQDIPICQFLRWQGANSSECNDTFYTSYLSDQNIWMGLYVQKLCE